MKAIISGDLNATTFFIVLGSLGVAGALPAAVGLANDMSCRRRADG